MVTAPLDEEIRLVGTILSQLQEAKEGAPEKAHLPKLSAALQAVVEARDAVRAALQAHADAFAVEMEDRMAVARQLEIDEAELMKKFGKGRRLSSFFLPREERTEEEEAAAPPAPAIA